MSKTTKRDAIARTDRTLRLLRCFEECVEAFASGSSPLPLPLCYQRARVRYRVEEHASEPNLYLFDAPLSSADELAAALNNFEYLNSDHVLDRHAVEYLVSDGRTKINALGRWILITRVKKAAVGGAGETRFRPPLWLLKHRYGEEEQAVRLVELAARAKDLSAREWLAYVEAAYDLEATGDQEAALAGRFAPNLALMRALAAPKKGWSVELDEELAELLKDVVNTDQPGSIRNLVKSINVSTQRTSEDTDFLMSLDRRTYWESDSYAATYNGYNAIRLFLKPDVRINRLYIVVSKKNRQHMPKDVLVLGGESSDDAAELAKVTIKPTEDGDVLLLEACARSYNYLEIQIKSCQRNGTNCRVYGVKIFTSSDDNEQFPSEIFAPSRLQQSFARLANFEPTFLYRRGELLLRFIRLFDLVIDAILPSWTFGGHFQAMIKSVKKLLVLSSRRISLLDRILSSIPTSRCYLPLIYIDRPLAFAYRGKPALDPKYQNTIFMQIYNSLTRSYSFRWEKSVEQWWECKFIGEGIIDQGGGFRDSLSDIAEELCPNTGVDAPVPLPFFVRSPNQLQADSNTYRDTFVPNPACTLFDEYEFIGKLMGACLRSKENLALYLAPVFWKRVSEENVTWRTDFGTVDAAEVRLLDSIEKMDADEYELKFAGEKTWSCVLSGGTVLELRPGGSHTPVLYAERVEYCEAVKRARLGESTRQIEAIKRGLQSVLSKHIFSILTWAEFEFKICGAPRISVEDLKMSIEYEDELGYQDNRVKFFWEAIANFSNEERSKFVRFVTGRKRLPVKIYFCASDQPPSSFPDSSTCNCSLYFPNYPNAQVTEEKLRYAIHNCVAIDTDCSSYED